MDAIVNYYSKALEQTCEVITSQQKTIDQLQKKVATIEEQYENLRHQLLTLIRSKFGKKSEKITGPELEDFTEKEEEPRETKFEKISYARKKPRNGHRKIPDNIPRKEIICELTETNCPCGCGAILYKIGEEISEQLEYKPAELYANKYIRYKYAGCKNGDKIITAPMPDQPIDKCFAGSGLLANTMVEKYDDHLPLYRQSERFARYGLEIARSTLCDHRFSRSKTDIELCVAGSLKNDIQ